jgi:hypothetical protein
VTVTTTQGAGRHTDVSLWFVVRAEAARTTSYDEEEFLAISWLTPEEIFAQPDGTLDPHMVRYTRKLASHGMTPAVAVLWYGRIPVRVVAACKASVHCGQMAARVCSLGFPGPGVARGGAASGKPPPSARQPPRWPQPVMPELPEQVVPLRL